MTGSRLTSQLAYAAMGKPRLRYAAQLRTHDQWTRPALERHHRQRLRDLLVHAARNVPYYAAAVQDAGIDPQGDDPFQVLEALPVLTKDVIRSHGADLIDRRVSLRALFRNATGGSTGEPVAFFQDQRFREISIASRLRAWGWSGFQIGDRVAWIWGAPQETGPAQTLAGKLAWTLDNRRLYDAFRAGPTEMRAWAHDFAHYKPTFIVGYASSLDALARLVLAENLPVPSGVRAVFSTAEQLLPEQRVSIESAFHAPVRDQYGSREVQAIAAECPRGRMHVASDLVHLEFGPATDPHGGQLSRILVTPLYACGMPLIRYDLGDLGRAAADACDCGLPYALMEIGVGRTSDMFATPDGTLVHGEYFTHLLYGIPGIDRFQFEQVTPELVRLRILPGRDFGAATIKQIVQVQKHTRTHVSARMRIEWETVEQLPVTATGKFRFTRSDLGSEILGGRG